MTRVLRIIYLGGIVVALVSECLFPTWVGQLYARDSVQPPTVWRQVGVFGLRGPNAFAQRTMLGVPPEAYDPDNQATIRWPWEKPSQHQHYELEFSIMFSRLSWVMLFLGYAVGILHLFAPGKHPDLVISVAWSISISLSVTWIVIYGLTVISQGGAIAGWRLTAMLVGGMLIGLAVGLGVGSRPSRAAWQVGSPQNEG